MQVPERAWSLVLLNFVIKLSLFKEPMTRIEFDSILVVVNRLIKWETFISYKEVSTAENLAYAFLRWIIAKHGLPRELILNRDKLFTLRFWTALMA